MIQTFPIKFGNAGQYELSENSFKHILYGDTAVRPVHGPDGRTQEIVLSGGLHTWTGWEKFVALHPKVVHLLQYREGQHEEWFYARELQNEVITLKIPRRLYTGDAASITKQPDLHYKSGYLWKTLYPLSYSEQSILDAIGEALENIDREDSVLPTTEKPLGVAYGYAHAMEPLAAIKLRIQLEGNQIKSAFPAWEQPYTGNNGKPYSHEHSISFLIAMSTVGVVNYQTVYGPVFAKKQFDLTAFVMQTPQFIQTRPRRGAEVAVDVWQATRFQDIEQVAAAASFQDLDQIESYLGDYVCAKDPFYVQQWLYANHLDLINANAELFNSAQLTENVGECLWVLAICDKRFNTRRAIDAIVRFLRMAVVHTGGLNTLMFKRLLGRMLKIALEHQDRNAIKEFLAALAGAPCRAALYIEFDLNPFVKKNDDFGLMAIGLPDIEMELKFQHLLEFIAFNLGENYLLCFSKEERLALACQIFDPPGMQRMAEDTMSLFVGCDFDFFMPINLDLTSLNNHTMPTEDDLLAIAKDYSRMLVLMRQRVVLEDPVAYKQDPDFREYGTQSFFELTRQKHKRSLVVAMHEAALENLISYADSVGYGRLKTACERMLQNLSKERIPMPKPIPDYIDSWQTTTTQKTYNINEMVALIFGGVAEADD
jgi:hypothetical protein